MPKIILTSRYLKNAPSAKLANLVQYMGTRKGVELNYNSNRNDPVTANGKKVYGYLPKSVKDTVDNIVTLLSKDFIGLVIISFLIASPVAWWFMHRWLQGYPYHVSIEWWIFAFAAGLSILIALITVSYHAIKAAAANPVKSLRTE